LLHLGDVLAWPATPRLCRRSGNTSAPPAFVVRNLVDREDVMVRKPPWKKANPRKKAGNATKKLSPAEKDVARKSARKAGRRYPNLVDNMRVARARKAPRKRT
jgi:hypothetical protein